MRRGERGFTLIELMISVSIVGILAAILVPSYRNFVCRTRVTEAKTTLRAIYTYEESYRGEYDHFVGQPDVQAMMLDPMMVSMPSRRYNYDVTVDANGFVATADGRGGMTGDTWSLDQSMNLTWVTHHPDCE